MFYAKVQRRNLKGRTEKAREYSHQRAHNRDVRIACPDGVAQWNHIGRKHEGIDEAAKAIKLGVLLLVHM